MKKELGPMAKLHNGPDNKSTGNGKNSISSDNVSKIAQNMASAGISGAVGGAIGKMVGGKSNIPDPLKDIKQIKQNIKENIQYPKYGDSDARFMEGKDEGEFTMFEGKPPYKLTSKELTTGKTFYQGEGPQATRLPKGTKEEMAERKREKRNERVKKRGDRAIEKAMKKHEKNYEREDKGKITPALRLERSRKQDEKMEKKLSKKRFMLNQ